MVRGSHHHVESGSPHDADTEAAPEIVMFFLGPDGEFLDQDPNAAPHRTLADVRRAWHTALESEAAHDPWARNRLGPRPVQGIGRPGKAGFLDEILVTARSGPERAVAVAVGPGLFSPPVKRVRRGGVVDHEPPLRTGVGRADRVVAVGASTGPVAAVRLTVAERDGAGAVADEVARRGASPVPACRQPRDERAA